ncbi:MAG: cell division protein FtsQ/DivIB [Candidatus Margulisbacteria bacterium]|nr:cell division protein FtsQ/DivIB [Candidatus Margulisiibacteriota bacterium]
MTRKKRRGKQGKPKKRAPRLFLLFFSLIVVIAVVFFVLTLPAWEIKAVVVNGAVMLSPEEVRALSGIPLSENLFLTSFSRAKENLQHVPAIKSFKFYRMPPQTVLISLQERVPIAALVFQNKSVIIDDEGVILNQNQKIGLNISNLAELPVVSGLQAKTMVEKGRLKPQVARLISDIMFKLSPYLESRQMQLDLGGLSEISFLLDDLLRVKLGSADEIEEKMAVFEALYPLIAGKWNKVEYIDVRYPDYPVVKYK